MRVVVGVAILVAIALLWPFADWNWWPVVTGLGVLVLLYLLRLNWLLLGWAPHLAGLITVTLLLARTGPWVWGFAAGLAVLGFGLVRLPDWRPVAVGAALTAVFGIGYGVSQYRTGAEQAADAMQTVREQQIGVRAGPVELALFRLANGVAAGDPGVACGVLGPAAGANFAAAVRAPDCSAAVRALSGQVTDRARYADGYSAAGGLPRGGLVTPFGAQTAVVDGCTARSSAAAGPRLGRLELKREQAGYVVVGYRPC
ncbi:MAG TPA: hypothetical protein VIQ30_15790 [Pseudonocardia sp.]